MRISASRLAAVVAARLQPQTPPPFEMRAEDATLLLDHPTGWDFSMPLDWIEDETEDRGPGELAELVVGSALSELQDAVSEASREPWPAEAARRMALPGTRRDDARVYFSYGESEQSPVLGFAPIAIADVVLGL